MLFASSLSSFILVAYIDTAYLKQFDLEVCEETGKLQLTYTYYRKNVKPPSLYTRAFRHYDTQQ